MKVYRSRPYRAAARQGNFGLAKARQQRSQCQHRRTHGSDQLIGRLEEFDVAGGYFVSTQLGRQHRGAEIFEQPSLGDDVANVRQVVERNCFRAEQRRSHAGQRGILGAAYRNAAAERSATGNAKLIHAARLE